MEIVRDIKERLSFIIPRPDDIKPDVNLRNWVDKAAVEPDLTKEYTLPDGAVIKVNNSLFRCPELLFQPDLHGKEMVGIHQLLFDSI